MLSAEASVAEQIARWEQRKADRARSKAAERCSRAGGPSNPTMDEYQAERRAMRESQLARAAMPASLRIEDIGRRAGEALVRKLERGEQVGQARGQGERAARALPLGLVTNATTDRSSPVGANRPVRERLKINREAQRCKRMKTGVSHAARLLHFDAHTERHAQRWNLKFITLTYADKDGWRAGHFGAFRKALNHWCRSRGVRLRFVWVAELQTRGAVHYHMIVWLPKGKFLPFADAQGWWPHGKTNIQTAQSAVGYITKYASKTTTADAHGFPKGARLFGHGGLVPEARRHIRYWQSPMWVRDALTGRADIRKVTGGYCDKITGEFIASPWRVYVDDKGDVWTYRIDQEGTIQ